MQNMMVEHTIWLLFPAKFSGFLGYCLHEEWQSETMTKVSICIFGVFEARRVKVKFEKILVFPTDH